MNSRVNYACESSNRINHLLLSCEFLAFAFFALNTKSPCFDKWALTFSSVSNTPRDFGIITPSQNASPTFMKGSCVLKLSNVSRIWPTVVSLSWNCLTNFTTLFVSFFDRYLFSVLYLIFLSRFFVSKVCEAVSPIGIFIFLFAIFYLLCRIFRLFSSRYLIPLITETLLLRMSNVLKYSLLVFFSLLGRLPRFFLFNSSHPLFLNNFCGAAATRLVSLY